MERLEDWVIGRVEQNFEISRADLLLNYLNNNCETPSQIRYLWPSILALCSLDKANEKLVEFGDKLRELKSPRALDGCLCEGRVQTHRWHDRRRIHAAGEQLT